MAVTEGNIKLEPTDLLYGRRQKNTVQTRADSSSDLQNDSWTFSTTDLSDATILYHCWYNVAGGGVDPAPAGSTEIEVAISADDTAAAVASATIAAIDAIAAVKVSVKLKSGTTDTINWEHGYIGPGVEPAEGVGTTFTFAEVTAGTKADLGGTEDIEFSTEFSMVDVKASQLGETLLDQIQNGSNVTISVPLLETTAAQWKRIVGNIAGDTLTVGANDLEGIGESKRFSNMKQFSRELVMRPSNAADNSSNITVFAAFPKLDSLNFSGSELQRMQVEVSAFRDSTRPQEISVAAYGDSSKGVLA